MISSMCQELTRTGLSPHLNYVLRTVLHLVNFPYLVSCLLCDFVLCFALCDVYEAKLNAERHVIEFEILRLLCNYVNLAL